MERSLPGDELVTSPKWKYTHAVTISAPPEKVWPWVVQIGQGRGGFYSYEFLENLVGCKIRNAERILPEFQNLKVGDGILLHAKATPLPVVAIEPGKLLLMHAMMDPKTGKAFSAEIAKPDQQLVSTTWLFYLEPHGDYESRLITRGLYDYYPNLLNRLFMGTLVLEPVSFVMERKMLLKIKELAEKEAGS